jgi:hypothetical protein
MVWLDMERPFKAFSGTASSISLNPECPRSRLETPETRHRLMSTLISPMLANFLSTETGATSSAKVGVSKDQHNHFRDTYWT